MNDFLRRATQLYPSKLAIVDGPLRFTYSDWESRTNRLANALRGLGVVKGDRVCILSPNSHVFLESFYATSRIGAILVPLNYRLVAADHEYILGHAGVSVVLVDREYTEIVEALRPRLPGVRHWIVSHPSTDAAPDVPAGFEAYEALLSGASPAAPPHVELDENDLVSINYTSGTTARPKGVMLTHRNCTLNAYNMIVHLGLRHDDVELWTLPMFHCNGWGGVYALTGLGGTHVVLRQVDGGEILRLIASEGVSFACMAPAVLRAVLDAPGREQHTFRSRPRFLIAGAPPPSAFIERLETELGWKFLQIYGLTGPATTISAPDSTTRVNDWYTRAGRGAGPASRSVARRRGTARARRSQRRRSLRARWCCGLLAAARGDGRSDSRRLVSTRAIRRRDETGSIHIVDRKKDVIITGGENVSSPEIEDALFQHPGVLECAVIGVPHEKWGETPLAIVVLRPGQSSTPEALIAFCRERLAHFKCPTRVEIVSELPRTATGKLQKFKLREQYWEGSPRRVN